MSAQGHLLDITVIGCRDLKNTEWLSKQDPYVILEYAGKKHRTKTDTDGGRNPSFNERYTLSVIDALKEINVTVCNSNTFSADDFIGSGKILLQKVLSDGYDDNTWPLTSRTGKRAGEIRIILHYTRPHVVPPRPAYHEPAYPPPGYQSVNTSYPPAGHSPYGAGGYPPAPYGAGGYPPAPYGAGGYPPAPSYGVQPPRGTYPPPQAYPPQWYPPQGYSAPPSAPYPPYQGGQWTR